MARLIDFIAIRFVIFLVLSLALFSITDGFFLAIGVSVALVLLGSIIYQKFIAERVKKQSISFQKLYKYFLIHGNTHAAEYIAAHLSNTLSPEAQDDYITANFNNKNIIIFPVFKYGKISKDDFLRMFRIAQKVNIKDIYIISTTLEREIYLAAKFLNTNIFFVRLQTLYRYLKNINALPILPEIAKQKRLTLPELAQATFSRKNFRRFMLTTIILLLMSILTPLTVYYYVMSGISLTLAILCLVIPSRFDNHSNSIFEGRKKTKKTRSIL